MTGSMEVRDWVEAGKSSRANGYIHPSGDISKEAYWESGREDASLVLAAIGSVDSVLEFGCGNGRILHSLQHPKAYGVDISPEVLVAVKNAYLVSEFDKTVEAVYSSSVFIHLKRTGAMEALQWIYDHLNAGGRAYLQIPIYDEDREPNSFIDVGVWSLKSFIEAVTKVGFKVQEVKTNEGTFSYDSIGKNHYQFQVLVK